MVIAGPCRGTTRFGATARRGSRIGGVGMDQARETRRRRSSRVANTTSRRIVSMLRDWGMSVWIGEIWWMRRNNAVHRTDHTQSMYLPSIDSPHQGRSSGASGRKCRTFESRSGLGRPSTVAAQPTRSGRRPNSAKTCPSRSGPGLRPPSTRHPRAVPGLSAAEGAAIPSVCSRYRRAACWHAGQVSGPPISACRGRSGRCDGISPMSTAQSARRMVGISCGSRTSSWRRNSAQAPLSARTLSAAIGG